MNVPALAVTTTNVPLFPAVANPLTLIYIPSNKSLVALNVPVRTEHFTVVVAVVVSATAFGLYITIWVDAAATMMKVPLFAEFENPEKVTGPPLNEDVSPVKVPVYVA